MNQKTLFAGITVEPKQRRISWWKSLRKSKPYIPAQRRHKPLPGQLTLGLE